MLNYDYRDSEVTFTFYARTLNSTACYNMHRSMLYNGSDVIRDVEWVIFDEVHYISDSEVSCAN